MAPNTAAYCGLYCESCALYKQTEEYEKGNIKKPDEICRGCNSDTLGSWCGQCNLKACAKEKGIRFCYECSDFPCDDLKKFADDPNYPYHKEVFDSLEMIKKEGVEKWMLRQEKRWSCPFCGAEFNWWQTSCPDCGKAVNGYVNPNT